MVGDCHVEMPVPVEVRHGDLGRAGSRRESAGPTEDPSAVAQKDRDIVGAAAAHGEIELAVAVEVGRDQRLRLVSGAEVQDAGRPEGRCPAVDPRNEEQENRKSSRSHLAATMLTTPPPSSDGFTDASSRKPVRNPARRPS